MKFKRHILLVAVILSLFQSAVLAVSDKVSLSLVEDFEKFEIGSNANFYTSSDVAVRNEDDNNYLEFFSDAAKPVSASKTVRPIENEAVLEFKIKELNPNANFTLYLRDDTYGKSSICFFRENSVNIGDEVISFEESADWIKFVFVFDLKQDKCTLTVNDEISYDDISLTFAGDKICGIEYVLINTEKSIVKIDDVRLYPGDTIQEEYSLLSIDGKAGYVMEENIALFLDYEFAVADNELVQIDEENKAVKPFLFEDKTFVPLRFVSEQLGAEVKWEDSEKKVSISLDETALDLWIDKKEMYVNGSMTGTDTAPILRDGRTYVPLRLVSETLNKTVTWDERGLIIVSNDNAINTVAESSIIKTMLIDEITGSDFAIVDNEKIQITSSLDKIRMKKIDVVSAVADYEPQEENIAVNAIDNDLATRWSSDRSGTNITLDLGEEKIVSGYALAWMNGSIRVNYYQIEYSVDGENWTEPVKKVSSGKSAVYEFYNIAPVTARYIRYSGFGTLTHDGVEGTWNSINEFVVFEEGE